RWTPCRGWLCGLRSACGSIRRLRGNAETGWPVPYPLEEVRAEDARFRCTGFRTGWPRTGRRKLLFAPSRYSVQTFIQAPPITKDTPRWLQVAEINVTPPGGIHLPCLTRGCIAVRKPGCGLQRSRLVRETGAGPRAFRRSFRRSGSPDCRWAHRPAARPVYRQERARAQRAAVRRRRVRRSDAKRGL